MAAPNARNRWFQWLQTARSSSLADTGSGSATDILCTTLRARWHPLATPSPAAHAFKINTTDGTESWEPDIAVRSDGSFVVTWTQNRLVTSEQDVLYRMFDIAGEPVTPETFIDLDASTDAQAASHIAWDATNDRFALVWIELASADRMNFRGLDAAGQLLPDVIVVNDVAIVGETLEADVAVLSDGRVVSAVIYDTWLGSPRVYAKAHDLFAATGPVNFIATDLAGAASTQFSHVSVAVDANDQALIVWHGPDTDAQGLSVFARTLDSSDSALGTGPLRIPQSMGGDQNFPSVAISGTTANIVWGGDGELPGQTDAGATFTRNFSLADPGLSITVLDALETTEDGPGSVARFSLVLTTAPAGTVDVSVQSSDASEALVTNGLVSFTASNWSTAQIVTVSGIRDQIVDGDVPYQIVFGISSATDPLYDALPDISQSMLSIDTDQVIGALADVDSAPNRVSETAGPGAYTGVTMLAIDPNAGDGVTYSIVESSSPFDINAVNGGITWRGRCASLLDRPLGGRVAALLSGDGPRHQQRRQSV
ncbi:MAG: hypothetical protein R3E83_06375 [Burkholderiaceae bacterium]